MAISEATKNNLVNQIVTKASTPDAEAMIEEKIGMVTDQVNEEIKRKAKPLSDRIEEALFNIADQWHATQGKFSNLIFDEFIAEQRTILYLELQQLEQQNEETLFSKDALKLLIQQRTEELIAQGKEYITKEEYETEINKYVSEHINAAIVRYDESIDNLMEKVSLDRMGSLSESGYRRVLLVTEKPNKADLDETTVVIQKNPDGGYTAYWRNDKNQTIEKTLKKEEITEREVREIFEPLSRRKESRDFALIDRITSKYGCTTKSRKLSDSETSMIELFEYGKRMTNMGGATYKIDDLKKAGALEKLRVSVIPGGKQNKAIIRGEGKEKKDTLERKIERKWMNDLSDKQKNELLKIMGFEKVKKRSVARKIYEQQVLVRAPKILSSGVPLGKQERRIKRQLAYLAFDNISTTLREHCGTIFPSMMQDDPVKKFHAIKDLIILAGNPTYRSRTPNTLLAIFQHSPAIELLNDLEVRKKLSAYLTPEIASRAQMPEDMIRKMKGWEKKSYDCILLSDKKPTEIADATIVIVKINDYFVAYWNEKNQVAAKSFSANEIEGIVKKLPKLLGENSKDSELVRAVTTAFSCGEAGKFFNNMEASAWHTSYKQDIDPITGPIPVKRGKVSGYTLNVGKIRNKVELRLAELLHVRLAKLLDSRTETSQGIPKNMIRQLAGSKDQDYDYVYHLEEFIKRLDSNDEELLSLLDPEKNSITSARNHVIEFFNHALIEKDQLKDNLYKDTKSENVKTAKDEKSDHKETKKSKAEIEANKILNAKYTILVALVSKKYVELSDKKTNKKSVEANTVTMNQPEKLSTGNFVNQGLFKTKQEDVPPPLPPRPDKKRVDPASRKGG
jgi:hypothetical protein